MTPAPDRRRTRALLGVVAACAVAGLAVVGLSVRGGTPADEPAPVDVGSIEWQIDQPLVDVFDLAEIHASSRLQYDECQREFAAVSSVSSSSRNPQYFC